MIEKEEMSEPMGENMEVDEQVRKLMEEKIANIKEVAELIKAIRKAV